MPRSLQPSAVAREIGTCTDPTITPGLASSLLLEGVKSKAWVLAGASGIPLVSHQAIVRSTACWVVLAQSATTVIIGIEDGVDVADGANLLHQRG